MNPVNDNFKFEVISHDDHGEPARCSYCTRGGTHFVVLRLEERVRSADGGEPWLALCAFCVLDMAKALQKAEAKGS